MIGLALALLLAAPLPPAAHPVYLYKTSPAQAAPDKLAVAIP